MIGLGKSSLDDWVRALAEMQGRSVVPEAFPDKGGYYRSDHLSFARIGVPSAYLEAGTDVRGKPPGWGRERRQAWEDAHYHQPSDDLTPDWDLSGAIEDAQLLFLLGLEGRERAARAQRGARATSSRRRARRPSPSSDGSFVRGLWLEAQALRLRDDIPPPVPPAGEALVRVRLAGICNTDLELVRGYYPYAGVPGHEFVGTVERAAGAPEWVGRRVVGEINAACGACAACQAGRRTHCEKRTVLGHRRPRRRLRHAPDAADRRTCTRFPTRCRTRRPSSPSPRPPRSRCSSRSASRPPTASS